MDMIVKQQTVAYVGQEGSKGRMALALKVILKGCASDVNEG